MTFFKNFIKKENIFENKNYGLSMPYIIAEIGVNHEGCIENAKKMIYQAKIGGAHAVKFQSYKAEKSKSSFMFVQNKSPIKTTSSIWFMIA